MSKLALTNPALAVEEVIPAAVIDGLLKSYRDKRMGTRVEFSVTEGISQFKASLGWKVVTVTLYG